MASDGEKKTPPSQTVILSELLASGMNALLTGKTVDVISQVFAEFYDVKEVKLAKQILTSVGVAFTRRSTRNDEDKKYNEMESVIKALQDNDYKQLNIVFAAANFNKICHVPSNLRDEIQLRNEVSSLGSKFSSLEATCKTMIGEFEKLSGRVNTTTEEIQSTTTTLINNLQNKSAKSYAKVAQRPKPMQPLGFRSMNPWDKSTDLPRETSTPVNPVNDDSSQMNKWQTVTRRKPTRKPPVLGSAKSSTIRCVKAVKVSSFFLSRLDPGTKEEELKLFFRN